MTETRILFGVLFAVLAACAYYFHTRIKAAIVSIDQKAIDRVNLVLNDLSAAKCGIQSVVYGEFHDLHSRLDKEKTEIKADAEKAAADLKAHVYAASIDVTDRVGMESGLVHEKVHQVFESLKTDIQHSRDLAHKWSAETHAKVDTTGASILDATTKALEVFHLQSKTLADHAAELKAHAKQYQDQAVASSNPRIAPSR